MTQTLLEMRCYCSTVYLFQGRHGRGGAPGSQRICGGCDCENAAISLTGKQIDAVLRYVC